MRVSILYSGGKDSNYALYWTLNQGWDVVSLVNAVPSNKESYMFHVPALEYVGVQAECAGIPLIQKKVSGLKEKEVSELEDIIKKIGVDGIVSGAIASEYQKTRIDGICENTNLKSFAPLWHKKPDMLLGEMISAGFQIMVVGVSAYGLDQTWLGRILDEKNYGKLKRLNEKYGIHMGFEGGEAETFVLDSPVFTKKIVVEDAEKNMTSEYSGTLEIKKIRLADK